MAVEVAGSIGLCLERSWCAIPIRDEQDAQENVARGQATMGSLEPNSCNVSDKTRPLISDVSA